MGCKINKRSPNVEDSIHELNINNENIEKPESANHVDSVGINPPPVISNEKDIKFKVSELVGEKKGNILDHYIFEKDLGAGSS